MIERFYFCVCVFYFFFCWNDCSISALSASRMTVNIEPIAFNIETTIDRDYSGGKRAARFNIFLEFYCFNQFHPNKSRILNGFLRWMRTTNSPGKDMCIENIWTAAFSLGTLCYFVFFFFTFFMAVTKRIKQKKDWERSWMKILFTCSTLHMFSSKIKNPQYRVFFVQLLQERSF